jgi:hypothetical protein
MLDRGKHAVVEALYIHTKQPVKVLFTGASEIAHVRDAGVIHRDVHLPVRKAVILIAEVIIYAISTNIRGTKSRDDKILERFAEATGGRVFFPFKIQDVADAFIQIQRELRSQYVMS